MNDFDYFQRDQFIASFYVVYFHVIIDSLICNRLIIMVSVSPLTLRSIIIWLSEIVITVPFACFGRFDNICF